MAYGLQSIGFVKPSYQEIFDSLVADIQAVPQIGNIRKDSASVFGQLIAIMSKKILDLWEAADIIYQSKSIAAEGTSLDDIVQWSGLVRIPASKSQGYLIAYGTDATEIAVGFTVRNANTNEQYVLDSLTSVFILASAMADCEVSVDTATDAYDYKLNIQGEEITYSSGTLSNGIIEVAAGLVTAINVNSSYAYAIDNLDGTFKVRALSLSDGGLTIAVIGLYQSLGEFGTAIPIVASNYGKVLGLQNEINQVITPVSGLSSVNNITDISVGTDAETDSELRTRFMTARSGVSRSTWASMYNAILQTVTGASNLSLQEDLPSASFEVIVECPATEEQLLAETIFSNKPAGIGTTGTSSKNVADSEGNTHVINYSKPTYEYVHVKIELTYSTEISFPVNGKSTIAAAVLAYGATLKIGNDLINQAFFKPVFETLGITSATINVAITAAPGDDPTSLYTTANIPLSIRQKPVFDLSRIHVLDL